MLINTSTSLSDLMEVLGSVSDPNQAIAIDTETNITDRYQDRYCMGISVAWGPLDDISTAYIPIRHDSWMAEDAWNAEPPVDLLRSIQVPKVFHNAKFDTHVLRKLGIKHNEGKIYDTLLMSHLIFEDQLQGHGLDVCAQRELGFRKEKDLAKIMKGNKWEDMPAFVMAPYAEQDAKLTLQLYYTYKERFQDYEEVWEYDERFMLLLQEMEEKGLEIDLEEVRNLQRRCTERLTGIQNELGFDPAKPSQLHKKLFGQPPDGLALSPRSRTPGGKPQVNTAFLEECNHPIAGLLLEWKGLSKQLTSYYNSYMRLASGYGRIHADFKQHGTVTGRMSCADPNMQQIPRDSPVKKLFLADPGKELWEIDFKNIEMRLAAVYSREPVLLETFEAEGDVHQRTADDLRVDRHKAKTINFLIIYGGGAPALVKQLKISPQEAYKLLQKYRALYPKLFATANAAQQVGEINGSVRIWSGRRRHFKWSSEANKAFNSIVQGGSFEIVKRSMLNLRESGFDIRNQVHDSVWLMVNNYQEVQRAEEIMSGWTKEAFGLTFSVESKRLN